MLRGLGVLQVSEEVDRLDKAIDLGRITAQSAGTADPIVAAISNAEAVKAYAKGLIPFWSIDADAPASLVSMVEDAEGRIFDAAANVRTNPDAPLPSTVWEKVKLLPWPWIAAGVGALFVAGAFGQGRKVRA